MKYLKYFESSSYDKITFTEFQKFLYKDEPSFRPFTKSQIDILNELFDKKGGMIESYETSDWGVYKKVDGKPDLRFVYSYHRINSSIFIRMKVNSHTLTPIEIFSISDEWYWVSNDKSNQNCDYYKCDQFDGLIKLLEEIL